MTADDRSAMISTLDVIVNELSSVLVADADLASLCTYKVGGRAAGVVSVETVETLDQISAVLARFPEAKIPILVMGRGSNLLIADRGFPGLVIRLGAAFESIEIDAGTGVVVAGGGALLPVVARRTAAEALAGFEWAVGVPGSIGGAVRMNAGGHGAEMAENLTAVTTYDLGGVGMRRRAANELALGYRTSNITASEIVLSAELQLEHGDRETSEAMISEIVRWRRANQPGGQNAGSVFANPEGDSAGRLIDALGLKGLRIGSAEVSTKHANFIQADPGGSADDVFALIREVQRRVRENHGIVLRPENVLVGFDVDAPRHGRLPSESPRPESLPSESLPSESLPSESNET